MRHQYTLVFEYAIGIHRKLLSKSFRRLVGVYIGESTSIELVIAIGIIHRI